MSADHLHRETIGAVVDGEMSPLDERAARAHLSECHDCALKVIAAAQLKSGTKRVAASFAPSQETLARLEAVARQAPAKSAPVIPIRLMPWAAVAAMFLLAIALGGRMLRQSDLLSAEILDQHLATLSDSASPEVVSTDRHTVKPWFQGKLSFSFNIPEPNTLPAETTLVGADLTYVSGKPAALLLFNIHKHHASVFVTESGQLSEFVRVTARSGFHFSAGRGNGLELLGVSDVNGAELDALVAKVAAAQ
jgi:anti-sigma factor RsiW